MLVNTSSPIICYFFKRIPYFIPVCIIIFYSNIYAEICVSKLIFVVVTKTAVPI